MLRLDKVIKPWKESAAKPLSDAFATKESEIVAVGPSCQY